MNNATFEHFIQRHDSVLTQLIAQATIPAARIKEAMLYSLFPGGKRIRPLLVYLCGEFLQVPMITLDMIAASIEFTHCYSLIHDDLPAMDDDDFRRGKPSCHRAFDEATAILVGDGMQAFATDILLTNLPQSLPLTHVLAVTHELIKASGPSGMVSGQSLDLSELTSSHVTESMLHTIHQLKTGKLIVACINMVLAASETATQHEASQLRHFGTTLGLVFQMQDDYLDKYDEKHHLGKGRASDSANDKTTFASIYGQDELRQAIDMHFEQTKLALLSLGSRAEPLLTFLHALFQRTQIAV
jgi:farnesyl diphosphate synthase